MRTSRLSLVSTMVLSLLGGVGLAATAQEDGGAAVTGKSEATAFEGNTVSVWRPYDRGKLKFIGDEGKRALRGESWQVQVTDVSDPRLAGTWRKVINSDTYVGGPSVWSSAARIDNSAGSWLGRLTGWRGPDEVGYGNAFSPWHSQGVFTGTGAYEGLTAVILMMDTGAHSIQGVVFPGVVPEVPEYPEPPTE